MTIYSGFSHQKLWFSTATLNYQRVMIKWLNQKEGLRLLQLSLLLFRMKASPNSCQGRGQQLWWVAVGGKVSCSVSIAGTSCPACNITLGQFHTQTSQLKTSPGFFSPRIDQELQRALETKLDPCKNVAYHPPLHVQSFTCCFLKGFFSTVLSQHGRLGKRESRYRCYHCSNCFAWCVSKSVPLSMVCGLTATQV